MARKFLLEMSQPFDPGEGRGLLLHAHDLPSRPATRDLEGIGANSGIGGHLGANDNVPSGSFGGQLGGSNNDINHGNSGSPPPGKRAKMA
jgi:hypothetical protein